MGKKERVEIEKKIINDVLNRLIGAGYRVGVHNGVKLSQTATTDVALINESLHKNDQDALFVYAKEDEPIGFVALIYNNDDFDVIADYTENLEDALAPTHELADELVDEFMDASNAKSRK